MRNSKPHRNMDRLPRPPRLHVADVVSELQAAAEPEVGDQLWLGVPCQDLLEVRLVDFHLLLSRLLE